MSAATAEKAPRVKPRKRRARFSALDFSSIVPTPPKDATYTPNKRATYAGNPLIEALRPPPADEAEAADRMSTRPDYDPEAVQRMTPRERSDCVDELDDFHKPTTWHTSKEQRLTSMLFKGLRGRNPLTPEGSALLVAGGKLARWMDPAQKPEGTICLIEGMSGMGKTEFVKGIARIWGGPVIQHTSYGNHKFFERQIVYLKVNCPEDGSLKGLASNLLFAVVEQVGADEELGNILLNPDITRKGIGSALRYLIKTYHVGILVIDEIRNLYLKRKVGESDKKQADTEIVAFLLNLRDEVKVPIILIGTPEAAEYLDTAFSINRRLSRDGDFLLVPPASWEDDDWRVLCEGMWQYQWTLKRAELTDELIKNLFYYTQGITGVLISLFQSAQRLAIDTTEIITDGVLKKAYETDFRKLHAPLEAIRAGNPMAKAIWNDIYIRPKAAAKA